MADRTAFGAILFVLFTGTRGSSPARAGLLWLDRARAVHALARAGVFERLHQELLQRLNAAGAIDWSAAIIDGTDVRALKGGT